MPSVIEKLLYSVHGFVMALRRDRSMRQWLALVLISNLAAVFIFDHAITIGIIVALGFLLLAAELINTAVEVLTDYVHPEHGEAAKKAKDAASAMTFFTFLALVTAWIAGLLSL